MVLLYEKDRCLTCGQLKPYVDGDLLRKIADEVAEGLRPILIKAAEEIERYRLREEMSYSVGQQVQSTAHRIQKEIKESSG